MKCEFCGRDMELIGSGVCGEVWECKKKDCGEGYFEENPDYIKSLEVRPGTK